MWRFIFLVAMGLVIGTRARSERRAVLLSLLFGLFYGAIEVIALATTGGWPAPGRIFLLLGLGVVLATPVYAVAELWRRTKSRALRWLRRLPYR